MSYKSGRPGSDEFAPYYNGYISQVSGDDALAELQSELDASLRAFGAIDEAKSKTAYEAGKWTIREVLGHIVDTERVMSYRAMRMARNDKTDLPGFEQDDFIKGAAFNDVPLAELLKEFELLRRANILLFKNLKAEAWERRGTANGKQVSVRALAFIITGHEKHHRKIVQERYLNAHAATH